MNLPFIIGLASVVATMSIGGGVLQERSRWLPAVLWVVVLLVGGGGRGDYSPALDLYGAPSVFASTHLTPCSSDSQASLAWSHFWSRTTRRCPPASR